MKDRDLKSIKSINKHIDVISQHMIGINTLNDFANNTLVQDAVVFNLLQIGEVAKSKLSESFKKKYSGIPWKSIYGFRNRLVHDYENIILTVVYEAITEDLPHLRELFDEVLDD